MDHSRCRVADPFGCSANGIAEFGQNQLLKDFDRGDPDLRVFEQAYHNSQEKPTMTFYDNPGRDQEIA